MDDTLIFYMNVFMIELEEKLNKNLNFFDDVRFQFDESNTDQQIKIKLKDFILENCNKINTITEIEQDGNDIKLQKSNFEIINVKVPGDLSLNDKEYIKATRNAIYTNPDLLFFINYDGNKITIPIEVKSTMNDRIPGSSIQQVVPEDWVIFLKHNERKVTEFITGKYIDAISGVMQFPDRSPRPQVSYNILKKYNKENKQILNNKLFLKTDGSRNDKLQIFDDWQMLLASHWLDILKSKKKAKKEPWFNNNIRKFSIILLKYYDSLNENDKKKFINLIKNNIDSENSDE